MDLNTARHRANTQMKNYGLTEKGWIFEFDRATSRLGQTNYQKKRITISKHFTSAANEEEFEQVLIHEMAHALLPIGAGHGRLWKMKAASLGYKGGRTARNPYYEAQQEKRRAAQTQTYQPALVAAQKESPTMEPGVQLLLPTGLKLTVQAINGSRTTAAEENGEVWTLSTAAVTRYIV